MNPISSDAPHALVIDDDFFIRMEVIKVLEDAGFCVVDAEHGDAAFELLKARHPQVVLLFTDVEMPDQLDGFAFAHKVALSWPHISIVVASGRRSPGPGSMPEKARFIAKPVNAETVYGHLQEILPNQQKARTTQQKSFRPLTVKQLTADHP
ncbi:response regulator (plasmid) [Lichenicola cladoniae]|uniref:Response regulator n=1 Tax=Lichenicola cladoniae TaxID=1484109 RepID=A0A6M8HZ36_9PROT|nr:response regulator [Lichenicola cladoniae]NPD70173.1 response regulator [Acetobacteraceae bacterium]QKE93610.1 response regulator [Lichenicola cladoniae]